MIDDAAKKQLEMVIVWKLDRFARNRYDSTNYKHILKKNGVKAVSATENITDGPEGVLLESLLEGLSEYYSAELSVKIHRGQMENALKGKNNGGNIPLGLRSGADGVLELPEFFNILFASNWKNISDSSKVKISLAYCLFTPLVSV